MITKALAAAAILTGTTLAATAAPGVATGSVNLRTGPGVGYAKVTTIPVGASIEVFGCTSWCQVAFEGSEGWVSARYVAPDYNADPEAPGMEQAAPDAYDGQQYDEEPQYDDQGEGWFDGEAGMPDDDWY